MVDKNRKRLKTVVNPIKLSLANKIFHVKKRKRHEINTNGDEHGIIKDSNKKKNNENSVNNDSSISSSSNKSEEEETIREGEKMKKTEEEDNHRGVDSEVIVGSSCNRSSRCIFDYDGILVEVLSWLPMKSLMRFKCVSKHWKFSISQDQVLIDLHFARSKQNSPDLFIVVPRHTQDDLFQIRRMGRYSGFKSEFMYGGVSEHKYQKSILLGNLFQSGNCSTVRKLEQEPFYFTEILKPVNGLICFVNRCYAAVCILNPSTREETPWIASSLFTDKTYYFEDEYRRGKWLPTYFFGFDPITKRHKVLCTWRVRTPVDISKTVGLLNLNGIRQTNICEVLTVGEKRWRRMKAKVPSSSHIETSIYANGFIYWGDKTMGIPDFLNSFDVGNEKFKVTSVPKEIREKCRNPEKHYDAIFSGLIQVGGNIALSQQWAGKVVKLWIRSDNACIHSYRSWTEMTLELPFQWGYSSRSAFIHGVAGADRIVIESNPSLCRADIKEASLYAYDLEKKTLTGQVQSGVVSKLISDCLYSKLESVSLFSAFSESLWPV